MIPATRPRTWRECAARCALALLLGAALTAAVQAQQVRTIDGRRYQVHHVEQGQTLYAISRSYAVPVDLLIAANPGADKGLSIGQELLIPLDAVVKKEARHAPELLKDGELKHTVAKKETLFGIARQYGVDVNTLLERNPHASAGLQPGMQVVIPVVGVQGQPENVVRPAEPFKGRPHLVQPGETLYSLGQYYGVRPELIQQANGGLPEGLKAGTTIIIPGVADDPPATTPTDITPDARQQQYEIGLLLPFSISRNDSVLRATPPGTNARYHETTRIAAQFYGGARMALDSLRKLGLNAEVLVMDMSDDPESWNKVMRNPDLARVDLFIGPFHRTAIERLARVHQRAHIVCPVAQSNKVILGHPTVSKVSPARTDLARFTARFIAARHAGENVIMLRPGIANERDQEAQLALALADALASRSGRLHDSLPVAKPGRRDLGDLPGKLRTDRLNVIVTANNDVEFVTTLVSKLKPLAAKYRITLVGTQEWYDISSVAPTDLDVLNFTFAAPSFIDPADPRVIAFTKAFRERYNTDADEYAFLGFDATFFYTMALMTQGPGFAGHFDHVRTEPLHMGFHLTRTGPENGFRNEQGVMLQQKELRLMRVQ
jgi:LysM repeat protein